VGKKLKGYPGCVGSEGSDRGRLPVRLDPYLD